MSKYMARILTMLLCLPVFFVLTGCQRVRTVPVWQKSWDNDVSVTLANCELLQEETQVSYIGKGEIQASPAVHLSVKGVPVLTVSGVEQSNIFIDFTRWDDGTAAYTTDINGALERLDYLAEQQEDGTLRYQLDTMYNYYIRLGREKDAPALVICCDRTAWM